MKKAKLGWAGVLHRAARTPVLELEAKFGPAQEPVAF